MFNLTDIEQGILHTPRIYYKENLLKNISQIYEIFATLKKDRLSPNIEELIFEDVKDNHSKAQFYKRRKEVIVAIVYFNLPFVQPLYIGAVDSALFGNKIDISIFISQSTDAEIRKLCSIVQKPHNGMLVYRGLHSFYARTLHFDNLGLQISCERFLDHRSVLDFDKQYFLNLALKVKKYRFVLLHGSTLKKLIQYQKPLKIQKIEVATVESAEFLANFIPDFMMFDGPNIHLLHQHYQEYCQNRLGADMSVQKMYSIQDFVHLISTGFRQRGIWCDFLRQDLYDPRLLMLIMRFTMVPSVGDRLTFLPSNIYSISSAQMVHIVQRRDVHSD